MADVYAIKNGDWSDTTVWNTGSLPASSDDVYANNYAVNIDQDIDVNLISSSSDVGVPDGVYNTLTGFYITKSGETNLICDVYQTLRIQIPASTSAEINITGDIKPSQATWPVDDGSLSMGFGIFVYGDPDGYSEDISLNITGDVYSYQPTKNTLPGGINAQNLSEGLLILNIIGDIKNTGFYVIYAGKINTISAQGDVHGYDSVYGASIINSGGDVVVFGHIYPSETTPTIYQQMVGISTPRFIFKDTTVIEDNDSGVSVIYSPHILIEKDAIIEIPIRTVNQTTHVLTVDPPEILTNAVNVGPNESDVRKGVVYGDKTGTLSVPDPLEVAFGIPIDNTVGKAAINLARLSEITGDQIAAAFDIVN